MFSVVNELRSSQSDPLHPPPLDYGLYSPSFHYSFSFQQHYLHWVHELWIVTPNAGFPPCGVRNDVPEERRECVASVRITTRGRRAFTFR